MKNILLVIAMIALLIIAGNAMVFASNAIDSEFFDMLLIPLALAIQVGVLGLVAPYFDK